MAASHETDAASRELEKAESGSAERSTAPASPVPLEKQATPPATTAPSPPPDGGLRAWLVVLGSSVVCFSTFGYVTAWGVFQTYYEETLLKNEPQDNIAWIGSIQFAFVFFPGVIAGRLFDYGYFNHELFGGTILVVVATILAAECYEYWQFVLCQGLAIGIGCGFVWSPSITVISHWFAKRRGFAMGFVSFGSSLGGAVIPIVVKNLLPAVGYKWTMRILGFILLGLLSFSNLVCRRRLPPPPSDGRILSGLFTLEVFTTNLPYSVYVLSTIFVWLGMYTALTFLDLSAISRGLDKNLAFYLVAIANLASGAGRICAGVMSDKIGPINIMAPLTTCTVILIYCWPFVSGVGGFIIFAILYGFSSGVFTGQLPIPVMRLGPISDVGKRIGYSSTVMALGVLCGTPISGAIIRRSGTNAIAGYKNAGWWSGTVVLVGVIIMLIARRLKLGSFRGRF